MKLTTLLILITMLSLTSCNEDVTASWLKIDKILLNTNTTTEGENSQDITDAWVYMDNQPLGVWELPCEIPILDDGKHNFTVYAGIKNNGISATRIKYPFYRTAEFELTLTKGETINYTPQVSFKSNLIFNGQENFEDTGIIINPNTDYDTSKVKIISKTNYPNIVKYGQNCGKMTLSSIDTLTQVFTNEALDLRPGIVYLEIDYMNTNTFALGINSISITNGQSNNDAFIRINAQEESSVEWKKIYLELTEYVKGVSKPISFDFYIVSALDNGKTSGEVYLDNIKIIQFD